MKTWVLTSRKQVRLNHQIIGLEQWRMNTGLSLEIESNKPTVRLPVCPQSGFHPKLSCQEGTWWLNMRLLGTLVADKRDLGWAHHDGRPNDMWECVWRVTDRSLMIGTAKRHLFGRFGWCVQYVSILVTRFSGFLMLFLPFDFDRNWENLDWNPSMWGWKSLCSLAALVFQTAAWT